MNQYLKYSLILVVIVVFLAYIYYELFNQFLVTGSTPIESNNTTIQFILLLTGIITIFFLYINYDLQRKQIKNLQNETDFNRALDVVYKQLEYIVNYIKNDEVLNQMNGKFFDDGIQHMDYHSKYQTELLNKLDKLNESLKIITFTIHSYNLTIKQKNYLLRIAVYNIGKQFLLNIKLLQIFETKNKDEEASDLYFIISSINSFDNLITKNNEKEKIKVSKLFLGEDN